MVNWNYDANDYNENGVFAIIPVGNHRVRIADAKEKQSKSGNDMIEMILEVSGHSGSLWHYIVFMPDKPQITNQNLGSIYESFGIKQGDLNLQNWIGKVGAARIKHETYNGDPQAKVSYFLTKRKQEELPAWVEQNNTMPNGVASNSWIGDADADNIQL